MAASTVSDWSQYWSEVNRKGTKLAQFMEFYRKQIISRAVKHYFEKYFNQEGLFADCGSGSSQTSMRIKGKRRLIALDLSLDALNMSRKIPQITYHVNGNILALPFRDKSMDGIWNLGVMEHFSHSDLIIILHEFKRVLKDNGTLILFWPTTYAPYEIGISIVKKMYHLFGNKKFDLIPEEISRLRSKKDAVILMRSAGFNYCKVDFSFRDMFTYAIVIAKK